MGGTRRSHTDSFSSTLEVARTSVRAALAGELVNLTPARATSLFKVRGSLCERAVEAAHRVVDGTAPLLPAWQRYSGVVWEHLDPSTLEPAARRRVLVPSALYGVTSATDGVADYRLTMSVLLPGLGNLGRFWQEPVTDALVSRLRRSTVVDLLPVEHAGAVDRRRLAECAEVVVVRFVDAGGGRAVGHGAKAVKGRVAATVLSEGVSALRGFRWEGWRSRAAGSVVEIVAPS